MENSINYIKAGVNIDKANQLVKLIRPITASTFDNNVLTEIGGFSGLFNFESKKYNKPILVSSTDGVGTKIKIAILSNIHDTVGIDLVAMSVNDILVCGAKPLFFMDYFATSKLETEVAVNVIKGITNGCKQAGCSLIGGETAEMPGFYAQNDYDLAGFVVGIVDKDKIIDGSDVEAGQVIIGLASTGLHSNGFSLVRKVFFEELGFSVFDKIPEIGNLSLGEMLLTPTKIYAKIINFLIGQKKVIKGMVHITGGGFFDNIPRILPNNCKATIEKGSWPIQSIFNFLQEKANISDKEMFRTFNCGIGMLLIVNEEDVNDILFKINSIGERAYVIGHIEKRNLEEPAVVFNNK